MNPKWLAFFLTPVIGHAQESVSRFELETGIVSTHNMEIRGFQQGDLTQDWSKSSPTIRLEYWCKRESQWQYGFIFQPLSLRYRDTFKSDLSVKGKIFRSGDQGTLDYQFPTIRFTANAPLYQSEDGSYIRAGGSAVVRYAKVALSGSGKKFTDTNLIALPLANIEASRVIGAGRYSLYAMTDFLPSVGGNVFLDGLYDVYAGVRKDINMTNHVDVGVRLFFGGYDPRKPDDYANRIFFNAFVVRYSF